MRYEVFGGNLTAVTIHLDNGEEVYTQSGGEGLFHATLEGPGMVCLQTMTAPGFAGRLAPFMPFKKND